METLLNLATAFVLGLMLYAFIYAMWWDTVKHKSKKKKENK